MADDDQDQHAVGADGTATIAFRVASICAMLDEHDAAETPMSSRQVEEISAMIDDVAAAAASESERTTTGDSKPPGCMLSTCFYEKLDKIGEGSAAVVTEARHLTTGQTVAMKAIRECCRSVSGGELLREACLMAACLGHPSIVALHGLARAPGTESDDYFLVMEHAGPSLDRILGARMRRTGWPFSETEARRFMAQLLSGAAEIHKHSIVHRDIKPENILVDGAGNVKIGDFGSAMSVAGGQISADAYYAAGTTTYSAPEMLLETPGYDARVDAWSLGCVMAELLTGEVLFNEKSDSDQLWLIYDVLGVPGKEAWKPHESSFVASRVPLWRREQQRRRRKGRWHSRRLRELFPEELLSEDGFKVLKGLLTCDPDRRLTAAAALKLPWFADEDNAPVKNYAVM
ncbi:putative cyclin-dependent kinase F-2 [Lolium rigidum]|uniref:putative cyclin-dependent kinase F-2 n=1 Tax=Lolium rigidum TaxID=89674 RepID=UPI001F5E1DEF|nr:putative cyclin-dependent kinase F-2 [Lolium rigidum]